MLYHESTNDDRFDAQPDCECRNCPECDGEGGFWRTYEHGPLRGDQYCLECSECKGSGKLTEDCPVHDPGDPVTGRSLVMRGTEPR